MRVALPRPRPNLGSLVEGARITPKIEGKNEAPRDMPERSRDIPWLPAAVTPGRRDLRAVPAGTQRALNWIDTRESFFRSSE